ncbi:hypothetical protein [Kribbella speibonae]|uniref:DNA-binding protein n=1 Tax=Kribbella speibonae TaxID=1572660 RepID=A0ABY2A2T6_9ACTN|nr:hypothetical protein [Kribbella speibonae]TCC20726.1 hypothetical protein E0H58_25590 [Kribbella speibonae]
MAERWYADTVTLKHFAHVGRLSVLTDFMTSFDPPYWTRAVHSEVLAGYESNESCRDILASSALASPADIPPEHLVDVFQTQIALGGGGVSGLEHLGEAECIVLADVEHCGVITDDNDAYDLISRRLGPERAQDTIDVLRASVRAGRIDASEAKQIADGIRNAGRHLRRVHRMTLLSNYFE